MTNRHTIAALFACAAAVFASFPQTAAAGPFRLMGYDTSTMSTANCNVAYGDGVGVLYTNPALLSRFGEMAYIEITTWKPSLGIELMKKPYGTDVPLSIYSSKMGTMAAQQDLALPTIELKKKRSDTNVDDVYAYVGFGMSMSLGIKGLRVANMMLIPIDSLKIASMYSNFSNEYDQYFSNQVHFSNFGEWGKMIDGLLGASYSPWDWISVGVGIKIGVSTVAKVDIFVPDATVQDYALTNNGAELALALKPIIGVQIEPTEYLSFGLVWRYRSYMNIDGGSNMGLWQFHETNNDYTIPKTARQSFSQAMDYEPQELAGGVGFKMAGFTAQASVTWNMWRYYLDNHHNTPQSQAHFPPSAYGTDPMIGKDSKFKFKDTVSVAWSGQYNYLAAENYGGEIKMGFNYSPSPVPPQIGRTNYADNTVYGFALGHKFNFKLLEKKFGFDVGLQYWYMPTLTVYKDPSKIVDEFADAATTIIGNLPISEAQGLQTNNPGFPGYKLGGSLFRFNAALRIDL